jgi:hypothetical protein
MQYAIQVKDAASLETLNQHLVDGWVVINMCSMPSSCSSVRGSFTVDIRIDPTCLVIVEKAQ